MTLSIGLEERIWRFRNVGDPRVSGSWWDNRGPLVLTTMLVAAVAFSTTSARNIRVDDLDDYGLPPAMPVLWFVGVAAVGLGATFTLTLPSLRQWLAAAHLLALVAILNGTMAIVTQVPHYAWTYKHIGVTRYIEAYGHVDPKVDIYHRWPGFFSLAATYSSVAGLEPVQWAAWAGVFFTSVQALLVVAIARDVLENMRLAWAAGIIFDSIDWVGQDYFAPQAFAFTLALGVLWLVLRHFGSVPRRTLTTSAVALLSRVLRSPESQPSVNISPLWGKPVALCVALVVFAVVVPSHQLTPFIIVLMMGAFTLAGLIRPWWLPIPFALLAILYLIPNITFLQHNFGLFTGLDPFTNVKQLNAYYLAQPGKVFSARAGEMLSVVAWILAFLGFSRMWRRNTTSVLPCLVALVAPFLLIFGQNYGGEAGLRVILFSTPWTAILMAGFFAHRSPTKMILFAPSVWILIALFVPAYFGQEELNLVPTSEVVASNFLYETGQAGSVVLLSGPNFPIKSHPRYPLFRGPFGDEDPNLMKVANLRHRSLGPDDVSEVVSILHGYSRTGYVVFSASQEKAATVYKLNSVAHLRLLEEALISSGRFRLYYQNRTTRIYQFVQ